MAVYDENIAKNPFFVALEKLRPDLCDRVAQLHGIILVPCCGSLDGITVSDLHFDSYVLQPVEDGYQTADGKDVRIQDRQVLFGSSLSPQVSVPILFEETFYNAREQSYSILCTSGPVEASDRSPGELARLSGAVYHLRSLDEVKEFLGRHSHKLDKFIVNFCQAFKDHDRKGLRHHIDSVHGLYTRCLQSVLRDAGLKVLAKQELQMSLLKQAVEVYVHHGIHSLIFNLVGSLEASQDAAFNKITRSLHELQHKDVGVKAHFSFNLSRAKRELSQLNQQTSPLLKLLCLRKVALTATRTSSTSASIETVSADDLLSVILYLLVKMEIPNWMANLSYMKNFCFSQSSKDELSYCLSTFEAAIEYISLGKLHHTLSGCGEGNNKMKMSLEFASASTPISHLFEHIAKGNEAEVARLLSESESEEDMRPCHPLCSCDLCDLQLSGKLNDLSVVTPYSRDERGYTPLHVAAICGQTQLIDLLVSKGAPVNATDYHTLTPLHLACQKGYQGVTLLLLHYKADADAQDNNGNSPLHLACMYGHEDCVKALVYYDFQTCCLDLRNDKGDTPLHLASRWGYEAIIQVLLENGASVHTLNNSAHTPAHCALNSKVLSLLGSSQKKQLGRNSSNFRSSARVSPPTSDRSSRRSSTSSASSSSPGGEQRPDVALARHHQVEKLLRAVADGDVEMVRYLLEWTDEDEADVSAEVSLCHPLCQCAKCAPAHKVSAVPCGALCVKSANADGVTPLHVSCTYGHAELTSLFVRHGADVNARTDHKATPLHLASQNNHLQVVTFLLECNAKLNKKDRYGNTALIVACLHGNLDTAATLTQSEALVNVRNHQGNTALHCAVRAGHHALVEMLLRAGASPHLRNKKHRTPLDTAYQLGGKNAEIVRSLQKASGLSPDDEPIKLLSVPKGALAHSFVQRLRLNDPARHKLAASRIQQMKKTSCSPTRRSASPEQVSPDLRRHQLRRVGTVDAIGPPAGDDSTLQSRGRCLARWHTLDSGEEAPEPCINVCMWTRRFNEDDTAHESSAAISSSDRRTLHAAPTERLQDTAAPCSAASPPRHADAGETLKCGDGQIQDSTLTCDTTLSSHMPLI
ncbi:ankyrin repeat domain-containing protein 27 isoform X2 [Corythoichthys intestinalis]|uniref:ankyrin repeat domain-containing protein 27 isoform X2 n=1 Tax=Corythoichthys intestinalis TaxID=161448 RepID=UPI0025A4E98C|nr:ankyrin repeat domain-containing protein 27 isoform X2 [Corythoichthys intestinalis]XP_061812997.1 ankyrin repeat domain-containing protein 27 [Nerophis lumbriciformis]